MSRISLWFSIGWIFLLFSGCVPSTVEVSPTQPGVSLPAETTKVFTFSENTPTVVATDVPTAGAFPIWFDRAIPPFARELILQDKSFTVADNPENSIGVFEIGAPEGINAIQAGVLVYSLAVAFPEPKMSESLKTLKDIWWGTLSFPLLMSPETFKVFNAYWGEPTSNSIEVMEESLMLEKVWKTPGAMAILPFDHLTSRWRALPVDGISPFDSNFSPQSYSLGVPVRMVMKQPITLSIQADKNLFAHYRREQITFLAMTGVTALSRRTAQRMNEKGVLYPQENIGALLSSADLTHISNEVSFNPECPPEKAQLREALFCSPPEYIQLLEAVGTDIVELTGNHNLDRGVEAYLYSLSLYKQRGWQVFGGGEAQAQASKPLLIENHGNRLAFIGCNQAGPEIAWAGENSPGAARCDLSWMKEQVSSLRSQGVLPIVTFQSVETEDYRPAPMQRPGDYLQMAQAGAVIVSGSQSHAPQGFSFIENNLIHFGLGNLFFDQTDTFLTSQAFIDWHVFYQGRYLGVWLIPIRLEDYSRPRLMTQDESLSLLKKVFEASLW